MVGLLTKTIIRSPVIRWIIQVRIRGPHSNDVAFVGDDFVHIKQVKEQGHLDHIATKADFDGRIRAAKVLTIDPADDGEDVFMKHENGPNIYEDQETPRQCLVVTTGTNQLLFLRLVDDGMGGHRFSHESRPLPVFDRIIYQPGEHIAIDRDSRALAVAANERELLIYTTRPAKSHAHDWCPVVAQRALQVEGVIQLMDFLTPPSDDQDHIILLLIVADQRRTKAVWIDWYVDLDLFQAQIHLGQTLGTTQSSPSLLVPLRNASFFLVSGSQVQRWKDILCGSATGTNVPLIPIEVQNPGNSPRRPVWVNWCRPKRTALANDDADHLYFVREDGIVCLIQAANEVLSSHAGDFECHVGTAFASIGDYLRDPDILIAGGDMSSGGVFSIGHWSHRIRVADLNRSDTMRMKLVEPVPNWSSATDMVTSTLPGKSQRLRDGVFITSGRQPYGAITELRQGLESKLLIYFELDGLRTVTDVWAFPLVGLGQVLIILSSPTGTRFLRVSPDIEMETIEDVDDKSVALSSEHPTIAAAFTNDGKIIQITRDSIRASPGTSPNFEDTAVNDLDQDSTILAAAIDSARSVIITAERTNVSNPSYCLALRAIMSDDVDAMGAASLQLKAKYDVKDEPICVSLLCYNDDTFTFVATSNGYVHIYTFDNQRHLQSSEQLQIPLSSGDKNLCDNMALIQGGDHNNTPDPHWLLICGLRSGALYSVVFHPEAKSKFGADSMVNFSQSAVKLMQHPNSRRIAYAMNGLDTCLLSWDGRGASSLDISNIWISDKQRPGLVQGAVATCTHMPPADRLVSSDLADTLVMISGDDFLVTSLDRKPTVVPRQILLGGTPNRLIYAEQQRSLVSASMCYDVPSSLPQAKPEEKRQIWPAIDFVPSRSSEISFTYDMQPGERVYALLEWSVTLSDDKTYSFILVGGSYVSRSKGRTKGRIKFLQPVNRDWEVVDVTESRTITFEDPVYALALIGDYTYAACVGKKVIVNRFSVQDTKWEQICAPFELPSPGIYISFDGVSIHVSTIQDSHITLELQSSNTGPESESSFEHYLAIEQQAPRADALLSHEFFECGEADVDRAALLASKHGQIIGLSLEGSDSGTWPWEKGAKPVFTEALLPRSVTRIRRSNIRPPWRYVESDGSPNTEFVACATDGTLLGITHMPSDSVLLSRLSWLQRLCEWSEVISPHSHASPPYTVSERSVARQERAMPLGLSRKSSQSQVLMKTNRDSSQDWHFDGDILVRLIERGGAETLRKIIQDAASRQDRVGEWMRQHLDDELEAVDEVMEMLESSLGNWL